jgi:hypothetical protein
VPISPIRGTETGGLPHGLFALVCTHKSAFCKRGSVNVRFAPKATEVLRCRELTKCARSAVRPRSATSMSSGDLHGRLSRCGFTPENGIRPNQLPIVLINSELPVSVIRSLDLARESGRSPMKISVNVRKSQEIVRSTS